MDSVTPRPGRRERVRMATVAEIKQLARKRLTEQGVAAISLRAIARDMGMSAAALYRYFPSLEALLVELCVDLYDELGAHIGAACDRRDDDDYVGRLLTAASAFRRWAVAHRAEFTLMFASVSPSPALGDGAPADPAAEPYAAALRFCRIFGRLFQAVYDLPDGKRGFALVTPDVPPLPDDLAAEIVERSAAIGADVPPEFAYVFLTYWIRVYGVVAMEVYGQLPVLVHAEQLFDAMLSEMARQLNVDLSLWLRADAGDQASRSTEGGSPPSRAAR